MVAIGFLTEKQLGDINAVRRGLKLHEIENPAVVYIGRHHYESRSKDGYVINDMWLQVSSSMDSNSVVIAGPRMTTMQNPTPRVDGYGNNVRDMAVFELSQRQATSGTLLGYPEGRQQPSKTQIGPPGGWTH